MHELHAPDYNKFIHHALKHSIDSIRDSYIKHICDDIFYDPSETRYPVNLEARLVYNYTNELTSSIEVNSSCVLGCCAGSVVNAEKKQAMALWNHSCLFEYQSSFNQLQTIPVFKGTSSYSYSSTMSQSCNGSFLMCPKFKLTQLNRSCTSNSTSEITSSSYDSTSAVTLNTSGTVVFSSTPSVTKPCEHVQLQAAGILSIQVMIRTTDYQ